jgi:type IV pilus assembly protein PilM
MSAQVVVGVDIGDDSVRAVEVTGLGKPRPTVERYREISLPEGAVKDGEVAEVNTVAAALRQLWSAGGFRSKKVVLGVGNTKVLVRDLTVPRLTQKEIRQSLPSYVQDMLPVPVADALLDFYPISESAGDTGPVVHGLLVAAIKDAVKANVSAVQLAGLSPVAVDLIPFALSRLHARDREKGTLAFIDVGARTSHVVVAVNGVPQFVRIMGAGGHNLTAALKDRLEITQEQAIALKSSLGLITSMVAPEQRDAVEIIHEVTGELLSTLRNTLNYFVNTHPSLHFDEIVLSGGGTRLPGFREALAEITRVPVASADPFNSIELSRDLTKQGPTQANSMAVALGLALGRVA